MADTPDQPAQPANPDPSSSAGHSVTGVPGGEPQSAADAIRKSDIDRLLGGHPLEASPLPPAPEIDLRSELGVGTGTADPRATTEAAAPPQAAPLTAEVVKHVESLSPEAANALVIGPSPDKKLIQPDVVTSHRKTVPAMTVEEAAAKAKKDPLPGSTATVPALDPEKAKEVVQAEIDRVMQRYEFLAKGEGEKRAGITKLHESINPLNDPEFQRFVRNHLSHVAGFYVITGQPINELRAEAHAEQLAQVEAKMLEGVDPTLAAHPAMRLAVQMGFQPNGESED